MDIVLKDVCLRELSYLTVLLHERLISEIDNQREIRSKLDSGKFEDESALVDELSECNDNLCFINDLLSKFLD